MKIILCVVLLVLLENDVIAQRDDTNLNAQVPRSIVWDKITECDYFSYVEYDDNGVTMVDRTRFILSWGGFSWTLNCAPGTLYSITPNLCVCSTISWLPGTGLYTRCENIVGDLQGSNLFTATSAVNNGVTYAGGYGSMSFSTSANCFTSDRNGYSFIPFFNGNSLTYSTFDIILSAYIVQTATDFTGRVFPFLSTGDCFNDNSTSSFDLDLRNIGGTWRLQLSYLRRDNDYSRSASAEIQTTLQCTIGAIQSLSLTWSPTDSSNLFRVYGNIDQPAGIRLVALNAASGENAGVNNIPEGGYCSQTSILAGGFSGRSSLIVSERDCDLSLGRVPSGFNMCMSSVRISRDC